jgi:hypothetical protein
MSERTVRERGLLAIAIAAIVNFFMLLVFNAHAAWRPLLGGVVTDAYLDVLWALNLGCVVQIVGNLILYLARPWWLRRVMDVVFAIAGLIGAIVVYGVFPFDLSRFGDLTVVLGHLALFLGIVGTSIAIFVNLVRLVSGAGSSTPTTHAHR